MNLPINQVVDLDMRVFDLTSETVPPPLVNADSTPTFKVLKEGSRSAIHTGNMTNDGTGVYYAAVTCSVANGFVVGKTHQVIGVAVVNGVTQECVLSRFRMVPAESQTGYPLFDLAYWRGSLPNALTSGRVEVLVGAMAAGVIAAATFAANALDAVWSTSTRTLTSLGSLASDVWAVATSGLSSAGTIGKLLVDNINATISSRLASASYTTPPTATENADALLARDIGSGSNAGSSQERTVRSALRFLRNKWSINGGTLSVKKEDDSTTAWTAAATQTAGNPVSEIDPT